MHTLKHKTRFVLMWSVLLLCILLAMMQAFGLSYHGASASFFSDRESTKGNSFHAGLLDLLVEGDEEYSLTVQVGSEKAYNLTLEKLASSTDLLVNAHVEVLSATTTLCDVLYMRVEKEEEQLYWGPLKDFNVWDVSKDGAWEFGIKYPDNAEVSVENGEQCHLALLFEAFDADASSYGKSGYTDQEIVPLYLTKTAFNCLGSHCDVPDTPELPENLATSSPELTGTTTATTTEEVVEQATSTASSTATSTASSTEEVQNENASSTASSTPEVVEEEGEENIEESEETATSTETIEEDDDGRRLKPTREVEPLDIEERRNRAG